jgi:hypothetical protein
MQGVFLMRKHSLARRAERARIKRERRERDKRPITAAPSPDSAKLSEGRYRAYQPPEED